MSRIHAHRTTARARLARALPPVGLGGILLALGISTGHIQAAIEALPLPEPPLNSYPLLVLAVMATGCWLRLRRIRPDEHRHLARLEKWPVTAEPPRRCVWPAGDPGGPGFGTVPFDLDPDEARPTLLPVDPEGRVRS